LITYTGIEQSRTKHLWPNFKIYSKKTTPGLAEFPSATV